MTCFHPVSFNQSIQSKTFSVNEKAYNYIEMEFYIEWNLAKSQRCVGTIPRHFGQKIKLQFYFCTNLMQFGLIPRSLLAQIRFTLTRLDPPRHKSGPEPIANGELPTFFTGLFGEDLHL